MPDPLPPELRRTWDLYLELGTMRAAAAQLGIHEITVRKRIAVLREMYGVKTNAQLAVAIERAAA